MYTQTHSVVFLLSPCSTFVKLVIIYDILLKVAQINFSDLDELNIFETVTFLTILNN